MQRTPEGYEWVTLIGIFALLELQILYVEIENTIDDIFILLFYGMRNDRMMR